jgi:hypothetical protein
MKSTGRKNQHVTAEELVDFVRAAGRTDQLKAVQNHLERCRKCANIAVVWTRVNAIARRRQTGEPPESTVSMVRDLYAMHTPKKTRPPKPFPAELLFDSFENPLQVGVRSSRADVRQLLFAWGDYHIDLRIEPKQKDDELLLAGQVLNATDRLKKPPLAKVTLLQRRKVCAQSLTNQFGEFLLECKLGPRFELRVLLPTQDEVSLPLGRLLKYLAEGGARST